MLVCFAKALSDSQYSVIKILALQDTPSISEIFVLISMRILSRFQLNGRDFIKTSQTVNK